MTPPAAVAYAVDAHPLAGSTSVRWAVEWASVPTRFLSRLQDAHALADKIWVTTGPRSAIETRVALDDSGAFVVSHPATGIYGAGDTLADAIDDLREAAREHLDALLGEESLSAGLQEQLQQLLTAFPS